MKRIMRTVTMPLRTRPDSLGVTRPFILLGVLEPLTLSVVDNPIALTSPDDRRQAIWIVLGFFLGTDLGLTDHQMSEKPFSVPSWNPQLRITH
jgi:hypothetical protein